MLDVSVRDEQVRRPDVRPPIEAAEIEEYLATTSMNVSRGPVGTALTVPGHSPLAWSQHWLRYFRGRRNSWTFYEEAATLAVSFVIGRLRPKVFFDVGAGAGYFSRVAASRIDFPPAVHAFEMRPACVQSMRSALERDGLSGRVITHAAALSDQHEGERDVWFCGTKAFEREPQTHEWQPPLWHRIKLALNGEIRGLNKCRVALTSIDAFAAAHGVVPELIKIDVDGYEGKVLRGGMGTFTAHKPVIALELHKDRLIRFGDTRQGIIEMMTAIGYTTLFLTDHQDRKACRVVPVDKAHPLIARQETDFILLC